MITKSFIYWFTRLDHLHIFCNGLSSICCVLLFISLIAVSFTWFIKTISIDENNAKLFSSIFNSMKKALVAICIACFSFNCLIAFLPTTKEMAAIYVIPKIANNESLQSIGSEMMDLAKEWLKELHPSNVCKKASSHLNNTK